MTKIAATVAGVLLACAGTVAAPGPAQAAPSCGTVTYPLTGVEGTVELRSANLDCPTALRVIDRYLNDETLTGSRGNTDIKEFDGWLCSSPTAAAARDSGYSTTCSRGDSFTAFVVVPHP